ncbi:MAG: metal ABC transporter solute-binding protein, Zn/Mn family [Solirubrobacteraceae bacterium]
MLALSALASAAIITGCGSAAVGASKAQSGKINAVGAESQYANVISQIGGRYVQVGAIMSNPNTDPHTFEASPSVAEAVSAAKLIVQNGLGYDSFMSHLEAASPSSTRKVIVAQQILDLPNTTRNPHLWYKPATMPAVAAAVSHALARFQPAHAAYFTANLRRFDNSLKPWLAAINSFANRYPHTPVATTEPVADYMLQAARTVNRTPWQLQADIMNGVDPAPEDITVQSDLFKYHKVKVFLYNRQVTDPTTETFLAQAEAAHVPVVGVYETMPLGYNYQHWMLAEVRALRNAVAHGISTRTL